MICADVAPASSIQTRPGFVACAPRPFVVVGVREEKGEGLLSVNVLATADRKNLNDEAVVFDDAQDSVAADAVALLT